MNKQTISCTRRIQFCAGHRVFGHESKCKNLHGHNYVAFITAQAAGLDSIGRVIDFSVIKERIGTWIDDNWDHGMILWQHDAPAWEAIAAFGPTKVYALAENPTAENMAAYLLEHVCPSLFADTAVIVTKIVLWETENCYAEVQL
jgi:6-pyruvoyltetrahydropterin/6-carboxytetrahydropterin synthase